MNVTKTFNGAAARLMLTGVVVALAGSFMLAANAAPSDGAMHHAGMMGTPLMGGPHMGRVLDSINASAEQRSQITQIMDAARADMRAQHDASRSLREQTRQLFTQPTVDARAAEALRQQMLAQHDQSSKRMMQAMLDVSRVLTPEQRTQLADRMAQRRGMMERHRAERDAAAPRPK